VQETFSSSLWSHWRRAALKAPLDDTLTRSAAHSFVYSPMEPKICWRPGFRCNATVGFFLQVLRPREFWQCIVCLM
jgi:hypothetical protein